MEIDPALRTPLMGTTLLGFVAGAIGSLAVVRRRSLVGDAVSHAALPGAVVALALTGPRSSWLVVGAALSGWAAILIVSALTRSSRISDDTALGGVLAVFFGLGLMTMSLLSGTAGVERYLFGRAATMLMEDVYRIAGWGGAALIMTLLCFKEFQVTAFDSGFARVAGLRVAGWDALMTGLIVVAVVIGLEAVGVVLMSALIVAPAVAARQWTDRLPRMIVLAGLFGAVAGAGGTWLSHWLSTVEPDRSRRVIPTGPTIVLWATAWTAVSCAVRVLRDRIARRRISVGVPAVSGG